MLNIIDEFTRECLAIRVNRKLTSMDVIDVLSDVCIMRGVPGHVRSDNGPEFVAKAVQDWIRAVGAKTAYIEPGSPWENGYCESFSSKLPPRYRKSRRREVRRLATYPWLGDEYARPINSALTFVWRLVKACRRTFATKSV